jgi:tight adherence protein C
VLLPVGQRFEQRVKVFTPSGISHFVGKRLVRAGGFYGLSTGQFIAIQAAFIGMLLVGSLIVSGLFKFKIMKMIGGLLYDIIVGVALPHFIISRKIAFRQGSIQKNLPNVLDLVTVSVEAGLSFDGALAKLGEKMKGPLIDEFNHVLQVNIK